MYDEGSVALCRQVLSKTVTQIPVLVSRNGELENRPFLGLTIQISTQKMEAACFFDTFISAYKTTMCHSQKYYNLKNHQRENLNYGTDNLWTSTFCL